MQKEEQRSVDQYIVAIPEPARTKFDQLRRLAKATVPNAREVLSYGVVGYKVDEKRAKIFISGWRDHVAIYPVPKDAKLQQDLQPYIKGKGTLWFDLEHELPEDLIKQAMTALAQA